MSILPKTWIDSASPARPRVGKEFSCRTLVVGFLVSLFGLHLLPAQEPRGVPADRRNSEDAKLVQRITSHQPLHQFRSGLLQSSCRVVTLHGWQLPHSHYCVLKELDSLQELQLIGTATRDQHLEAVSQIPGLRSLDLRGNPITDAGLTWLSNLPHLRSLDLRGTAVTEAAARDWKNQHPHVRVYYSACRQGKQTVQLYAQALPAASPLLRQAGNDR